jgi:pilus assembly protein CpaF
MESEVITMQDIFEYKMDEVTADGKVVGGLRPTGLRPGFLPKFEKHGVEFNPGGSSNGRSSQRPVIQGQT